MPRPGGIHVMETFQLRELSARSAGRRRPDQFRRKDDHERDQLCRPVREGSSH